MRQLIVFIAFIFIFSSCVDKSKNNITVFRATEEGLQQSIQTISISNEILYRSMKERLQDPQNMAYVMIWEPKAMEIKRISDSMIRYLEALKEELKNEAGPDKTGNKGSFKEDDIAAVNHLFNDHEKGKELFDRLIKYRRDILAIDTELNKKVNVNHMIVFARGFDYTKSGPEVFTRTYVNDIPVIAAMAMLSKFENNIKINENELITFCHNKTYYVRIIDDFPTALITQSSNYVKAGEEIEITAGIGTYSAIVQPKININGKDIALSNEPVAIYKLKASMKSGKYHIPVKIEFMKPDGTKAVAKKDIEYTVIEEK
jgi:gliding motility-associated protein GldM